MHCRSRFFEYLEANGKDSKYIGSVLDDIYSIYKTKNIGDECTSISKMYMLMAYLFENCYRVWAPPAFLFFKESVYYKLTELW